MVSTHTLPFLPLVFCVIAQVLQEPSAQTVQGDLRKSSTIDCLSTASPLISFKEVQLTFVPMVPHNANHVNSQEPIATPAHDNADEIGIFGIPIPTNVVGSWYLISPKQKSNQSTILTLTSKGTYRLTQYRRAEKQSVILQKASGSFSVIEDIMAVQPDKGAGCYLHIHIRDNHLFLQDNAVPYDPQGAVKFRYLTEVATPSNTE